MIRIREYQPVDAEAWDTLIFDSNVSSFLHSRRFLAYHGARFVDRSLVALDADGNLRAVFPAAELPGDSSTIVSHPGATFGGVIHDGNVCGNLMCELLDSIIRYYAEKGFRRLLYKKVPSFYLKMPDMDDGYGLFCLNAARVRCDLTATIDLRCPGKISARRRRGQKKADRAGIYISRDGCYLEQYWQVLQENLKEQYDATPVHTSAEISMLARTFPEWIRFLFAILDSKVLAGTVLFETPTVSHAQYIASSSTGRAIGALDAVFSHAIRESAVRGKWYFDFGISNENEGRFLNEGLYKFKREFGAGGALHEFFEVRL